MPQVTPEGFAHMTKLLMDAVPGGRIILALEVGVRGDELHKVTNATIAWKCAMGR
jgi:hypothetical protein